MLEAFRRTDVFPTCFEDDPHWNNAGADVAADAISSMLIDDFGHEIEASVAGAAVARR